jgi:hypothetical protein
MGGSGHLDTLDTPLPIFLWENIYFSDVCHMPHIRKKLFPPTKFRNWGVQGVQMADRIAPTYLFTWTPPLDTPRGVSSSVPTEQRAKRTSL